MNLPACLRPYGADPVKIGSIGAWSCAVVIACAKRPASEVGWVHIMSAMRGISLTLVYRTKTVLPRESFLFALEAAQASGCTFTLEVLEYLP